ncbi:GAF domain-containing protein [Flavobacterium endoglycinae]|uniref:histidine kinase n=1 Tax=Flavobacterium endoglycinae TaxID=2816357 RepID=A0ABX7QCW6_9FLAO|nr:ATP-binding protein [Flavobacterium endoglycinae]QSW88441.1 GAF domain-containing protein [Flavobacterium endoglycinae]
MNIKDIVNRDLVTLTNCDQEPIHIPGKIQPHGFLLGLTNSWTIDYCTDNISFFINLSHIEALGNKFESVFGSRAQELLFNYINSDTVQDVFPLEIELLDKKFQVNVHKSHDIYVLEAEPQFDRQILGDVYTQTIQFVTQMNSTKSLKDLCALVAEGTREITGYDRVMIYRFDEQYNGEVYAESCRKDLEPFFGLHYPHTDIPVQARELYIRNQMRLIVDINYEAVPIFTVDDKLDKNLDLSLSVLRSTSPIHVQYLKNMGVGATLTISLLHHGRLWGLIACHHYSKKNISPAVRLAAKLQGQFITSQIDIRESNDENLDARKTIEALEHITAIDLPLAENSLETVIELPELLALCNAAGVSILFRNKIYKNGLTPEDHHIVAFAALVEQRKSDDFYVTRNVGDQFPELENSPDFAGAIYHSLGGSNHIIWYRPETISEINWAGDPEKSIVKDQHGLHPRNSFNSWKQIVKGHSSIWKKYELNSAAKFAHSLHKNLIMILLSEEEEKYRRQSEVLRETNSELENINWISTHDLQEPLRKIQMITSKLLADKRLSSSDPEIDSLERVSKSATRMRELLQDILKYTRIKNTREAAEKIDLNLIFESAAEECSELIEQKNAVIHCEQLPEVSAIGFLMKQLFLNIIQNSLKYASLDRSPVITITASQEPVIIKDRFNVYCHWVKFSDNGIGFDQMYSESIFKVFTRLHNQQEYSGSGIGLALCKKIMQSLGGSISAEGAVGEGASITIYFPCDPDDTLI